MDYLRLFQRFLRTPKSDMRIALFELHSDARARWARIHPESGSPASTQDPMQIVPMLVGKNKEERMVVLEPWARALGYRRALELLKKVARQTEKDFVTEEIAFLDGEYMKELGEVAEKLRRLRAGTLDYDEHYELAKFICEHGTLEPQAIADMLWFNIPLEKHARHMLEAYAYRNKGNDGIRP